MGKRKVGKGKVEVTRARSYRVVARGESRTVPTAGDFSAAVETLTGLELKPQDRTIRIGATEYHEMLVLSEQSRVPIRTTVDLLATMAISALSSQVRLEWAGQELYKPQSGPKVVKMGAALHDELKQLTDAIGLSVSTAVMEAFYARRKYITSLRGLHSHELVQCNNALHEARRVYRELQKEGPKEK